MQWIAETVTKAIKSSDKPGGSPLVSEATTPQDATTFALIYGLPLLSYSHLASKIEENKGHFETNSFYHQKKLASAEFTDINRPNVDTLYSEALVDLSVSALIVTIPEVPTGRFYVFPIYDVYGNNVVNIGTAGVSSTPGRYLLSYRPADPGYGAGDDTYAGYIYLPTPYGAIDLRIQVNGTDDVKRVNALQVLFTLSTVSMPVQLAPRLTKPLLFDGFSSNRIEKLLQLTARLSPFNLPEVGYDIARVTAQLELAGLTRGSYTTPSGVDLTLAMEDAVKAIAAIYGSDTYFLNLGNDWSQLRDKFSGDFKAFYTVRAFVAAEGYLQLTSEQCIYPIYSPPTKLTSENSYTVTFSRKPPVTGFWSLTVYDQKAYLVANQWDIYSLGDRSAIEYSDGSLVYPTDGSTHDDDEFTILLQTQDITPPDDYQSNWIPTPQLTGSSTEFNFTIRWYGPTQDLKDGTYVYPTVKTIAPITA